MVCNVAEEQQRAAIALAKAVEGTVFPAVSFGPLAHALCRLVPSQNRTYVALTLFKIDS
jgi:hypothetical protein